MPRRIRRSMTSFVLVGAGKHRFRLHSLGWRTPGNGGYVSNTYVWVPTHAHQTKGNPLSSILWRVVTSQHPAVYRCRRILHNYWCDVDIWLVRKFGVRTSVRRTWYSNLRGIGFCVSHAQSNETENVSKIIRASEWIPHTGLRNAKTILMESS